MEEQQAAPRNECKWKREKRVLQTENQKLQKETRKKERAASNLKLAQQTKLKAGQEKKEEE
jgi:hypothetical protein